MPSPRAVFFDLDDTLLDNGSGVQPSWEAVGRLASPQVGCDWQEVRDCVVAEMKTFWEDEAAVEHWRTRLDDARVHVMTRAFERRGWDTAGVQQLSDLYWSERQARMALFDDALHTLETLRSRGFRLALLTNGPADMQRGKVKRFELASYFDDIVIEGEFGRGKPHREVFERALATVGAQPHEAWHVGDNLYADIGGAQAAGVHATWIHRDRLQLKEGDRVPDRVIGHLPELLEAIGR